MRLVYEFEMSGTQTESKVETEGNLKELIAATGELIHQIFFCLPDDYKTLYREAIRVIVTDEDSRIWKNGDDETWFDL